MNKILFLIFSILLLDSCSTYKKINTNLFYDIAYQTSQKNQSFMKSIHYSDDLSVGQHSKYRTSNSDTVYFECLAHDDSGYSIKVLYNSKLMELYNTLGLVDFKRIFYIYSLTAQNKVNKVYLFNDYTIIWIHAVIRTSIARVKG